MTAAAKGLVRATIPSVVEVGGVWTGGGAAADCTKASGDWNVGIASVKYNAATGKYRITFTETTPGHQVVGFSCDIARVTTVTNALVAKMVAGSYSKTAGTLDFEVCDVATPSGVDLATTDKLMIVVRFSTFPPNS